MICYYNQATAGDNFVPGSNVSQEARRPCEGEQMVARRAYRMIEKGGEIGWVGLEAPVWACTRHAKGYSLALGSWGPRFEIVEPQRRKRYRLKRR